jgi:hypothetical protein
MNMSEHESIEIVEDECIEIVADETPSEEKPKKKTGMIIAAVLVGLYAIGIVAAVILQEPAPPESTASLSEQYTAKIVAAHNELMSVKLDGVLNPGEKIGSVKKSLAASELNKRIKVMRTNAELLKELEPEEGEDPLPEEVDRFATFITDEWVPFWDDIESQIGDVSTTDEAFALFDELKVRLGDEPIGADMEAAFRSMARIGESLGWDPDSYTARIR